MENEKAETYILMYTNLICMCSCLKWESGFYSRIELYIKKKKCYLVSNHDLSQVTNWRELDFFHQCEWKLAAQVSVQRITWLYTGLSDKT